MVVHKLIIHEIIKEEFRMNCSELKCSDELLMIGDKETDFITQLNGKYRTLRHSTGVFKSDSNFKGELDMFIPDPTEDRFTDFTKRVVGFLKNQIDVVPPAKGGFLVIAEYEDHGNFIGVFFVRNKKGNRLIKREGDNTFTINETIHIDLESMHMACRINSARYENSLTTSDNGCSYITFINRRNQDSKYFISWIGATNLINDKEDTRNLLDILLRVGVPTIPQADGSVYNSIFEFRNDIYKYIKSFSRGELVDLKDIGNKFYEDANKLTDYAFDNDIDINHQFKPDNRELQKFVDIKVKSEKIDLSFPQSYLEDGKIEISDEVIIINSKSLVDQIQENKVE